MKTTNAYAILATVTLGLLTYIKAQDCDLECGPGYSCTMTRGTCIYPPCRYFATCTANRPTEGQNLHANNLQRHPSHGSHLGSILSNEGVELPQVNTNTRSGQCPALSGLGPCVNSCRADVDCPTSQKCCNNGCGRMCRSIVNDEVVKPGTCPRRFDVLVTSCQQECNADLDCPGVQKCCRTNCAAVCSDPCYYWIAPNQRSNRKAIIWKLPFFCRL